MGKQGGRSRPVTTDGAWEILRGGKMPKGLVDRLAGIGREELEARARLDGIGGEMAGFLADAQGRREPIPADPRSRKAQEGLLTIHGRLGKRKLAPPRVASVPGGISGGRIVVTVVPLYDFALTIKNPQSGSSFGPATVEAAASKSGALSCSAISTRQRSMGSAFAQMGIFFHPLSAGRLRVSAKPSFSFQWWTNSLAASEVRSFGSANLVIHGLEQRPTEPGDFGIVSSVATPFKRWDETAAGEVRLDARFDRQSPVAAEIAVSRSRIYLVTVTVSCAVLTVGWPGSLAGAMLSASVPSFTWEFEPEPVLTPG